MGHNSLRKLQLNRYYVSRHVTILY